MALSDVYTQAPWAPAQGVQAQQQEAFGSLPGLAQQKMQMDAQQAETERNARPVTAWEKAAARIMAGHDPKEVAKDTKAELGGQPPSMGSQMQPGQQQTGLERVPTQLAQEGQGAPPLASNLPQPVNRGGISSAGQGEEDVFKGMNHRDWGDYMGALEKAHKAKQDRDYLAEIALRNKGNEAVANVGAGAKVETAKIKAGSDIRKMDIQEHAHELDRRVKEGFLDEKTANDVATIQLGYAKLKVMREHFASMSDGNDKLKMAKILYEHADRLEGDKARIESSLTGIMLNKNIDIVHDVSAKGVEAQSAAEEAKKYIGQAAQKAHSESVKTKESAPAGVQSPAQGAPSRQHKVGDSITYNGKTLKVEAVDANGRITKPTPADFK